MPSDHARTLGDAMSAGHKDIALVESVGLAWALGLALFTALSFALYLCGVPTGATVLPALALALGAVVMGLRLLWRVRREDDGVDADQGWQRPAGLSASNGGPAGSRRSQGDERKLPANRRSQGDEQGLPGSWRSQGDGQETAGSRRSQGDERGLAANRWSQASPGWRMHFETLCALAVVAAVTAHAAWLALRAPLSAFDAWSLWAFKARMFLLGGPRPSYFHDPATLQTHPDYPLNLPLAEAALFRLPGGLSLAALLGPACLAALLLLLFAGLARLHGRGVAALGVTALALLPALTAQSAGGDADVPLALYAGGAALYLLLWWRFRRPADAMLMALLAGGAIWTKKEGLAVAALLLLAYIAGELWPVGMRRKRAWGIARTIPCALALPLPWLLCTRAVHPTGRDFLPFTIGVFMAHLDRLPHIAVFFALQMLDFANWSLLWLVLAGCVLLAWRRLDGAGRGALLLLLGQLALYMLAFVFSDWQPYTDHLRTSLDRLLVQAAPLAVVALLEAAVALGARRARPAECVAPATRQVAAR